MYPISKVLSPKSRRALSTVVTSAILMSSAAIMGSMLLAWSNENLLTKQNNLELSFNEKMNRLNESLLVESVWFGTNPSVVNVTLSNSGTIGLNVTEVWIQNSTSQLFLYFTDGGMTPSTTNGTFSFQESFYWTTGEVTDFTVFTERGKIYTFQDVT